MGYIRSDDLDADDLDDDFEDDFEDEDFLNLEDDDEEDE